MAKTRPIDAARRDLLELRDKAFFDKLETLGFVSCEQSSASNQAFLIEQLTKMADTKTLLDGKQSPLSDLDEYVDEAGLTEMLSRLMSEHPELIQAAETFLKQSATEEPPS